MREYYYRQIYNKVTSYPIVIYGMGDNGIYAYNLLKELGIEIECFVDRDDDKCKKGYDNVKCKKLEEVIDKDKKNIIVTPLSADKRLIEQLQKFSFKNIIVWWEIITLRQMQCSCAEVLEYLRDNIKYKDKYRGKRCFIIGNGPSLKKQNILKLKDEIVFTVNNAMKLEEYGFLKPKFHVYIDSMFFDTDGEEDEINERVKNMKSIGKETVCFVPYTKSKKFIEKYDLREYLNISYLEEDPYLSLSENSMDFQKKVANAGTVVITSIMLAMYMGFDEIYLLGCDCTDILTTIRTKMNEVDCMEYAYKLNDNDQLHIKNTIGTRPLEIIYRSQYHKYKCFRLLNQLCKQRDIKLYDCTKDGLLDCVEKIGLETVLDELNSKLIY